MALRDGGIGLPVHWLVHVVEMITRSLGGLVRASHDRTAAQRCVCQDTKNSVPVSDAGLIKRHLDAAVATLTLNDPMRRNPLSPGLVSQLTAALQDAAQDPSVRCVVVTGAGRGFCAGADLRRMRLASPLEDRDEYDAILDLNRLMWNFPKPTIAAVHGFVLGAGANLMNWCDIAVVDEDCLIGFPEVRTGVPSATVIPSLLRLVGRKKMYELVLTGEPISPADAAGIGLVSRVTAPGTSLQVARSMASIIAEHHPDAIRLTKEIVYATSDMAYEQAIVFAKEVRVISRLRDDFRVEVAAGGESSSGEGDRR
jgi:enoyl-CoA hydratase/carnithine racemase